MGGRGAGVGGVGNVGQDSSKYYRDERWDWLKEVPNKRLENYIKRADFLKKFYGKDGRPNCDPQGRSIGSVGYWAKKELERRGIK